MFSCVVDGQVADFQVIEEGRRDACVGDRSPQGGLELLDAPRLQLRHPRGHFPADDGSQNTVSPSRNAEACEGKKCDERFPQSCFSRRKRNFTVPTASFLPST